MDKEKYVRPIRIREIYNLFGCNTTIRYMKMFCYDTIDNMPEARMNEFVEITAINAKYDGETVIGSFVECICANKPEDDDLSIISKLVEIIPPSVNAIILNREEYVGTGVENIRITSNGYWKAIIDKYGDETISCAIFIIANCNLGVDITYSPYKE